MKILESHINFISNQLFLRVCFYTKHFFRAKTKNKKIYVDFSEMMP